MSSGSQFSSRYYPRKKGTGNFRDLWVPFRKGGAQKRKLWKKLGNIFLEEVKIEWGPEDITRCVLAEWQSSVALPDLRSWNKARPTRPHSVSQQTDFYGQRQSGSPALWFPVELGQYKAPAENRWAWAERAWDIFLLDPTLPGLSDSGPCSSTAPVRQPSPKVTALTWFWTSSLPWPLLGCWWLPRATTQHHVALPTPYYFP